jgi:hypothetical protein
MINYPTVKDNLKRYIAANFPILYICTFDEAKVEGYIEGITGKNGLLKNVLEWNGVDALVEWTKTEKGITKVPKGTGERYCQLEDTLADLNGGNGEGLDQTLLIIKDAAELSSPVVVLLKDIARKISAGIIKAAVVIISPTVDKIPLELEKMTAIMELGFPDEKEIISIIKEFMGSKAVNQKLLKKMSRALKGLTEFEIKDLLRLAIYDSGNYELPAEVMGLIFE